VFHSARWDQACDFAGKHVASIGTGGSAIQYCPRIAPLVARLDVYQRTPAWVIPRDTRRYSDGARRRFTRFDAWRRLHRARLYWTNESRVWPIFHPGLARVQAGLRDTVWSTWCRSWYQQDDGRNFTIWPWSTWRYWLETRRVDASRYRFGKATVAAAVLAASLAMSACSGRSSPEVQVRAVIEAAEDAAERRDHAELMALVSPEFSGAHGEDVRDVSQQVRGYLLAHPSVHVATRIDGIEFPYEDMARVQLTVGTLGGDASTLELSADAQSVELELQNEGGEWRVTRAGWEPVLER
jgi:cation diffusion facilitator CzcD-associated flavoprotein CzcO